MVMDQEDLILSPNVLGPDAKAMMPPGVIELDSGKAYMLPKLGGNHSGAGGRSRAACYRRTAGYLSRCHQAATFR